MDFPFSATVTVYSTDDEHSIVKHIIDVVEADSQDEANDHAEGVVNAIVSDMGADQLDWPAGRIEIDRFNWA